MGPGVQVAGGQQAPLDAPNLALPLAHAHRCFGLIKYVDLQRNAQSSAHQLLASLHNVTIPRHIQNRAHQLVGRAKSGHVEQEERLQRIVDEMVGRGAVQEAPGPIPGRFFVYAENGAEHSTVCLGDLSCSCNYSGEAGGGEGSRCRHACMHACMHA